MIDVYCDAYLCACPPERDRTNRFQEYIEGILMVRQIASLPSVDFYISRCTAEALYSEGKYPQKKEIERIITELGRDDITPRDVIGVANALLEKQPFLEDNAKVNDILYEDFKTEPAYFADRGVTSKEALEKHLVLSAFVCHQTGGKERSVVVATTGTEVKSQHLDVHATLTCVDGVEPVVTPAKIGARLGFCEALPTLAQIVNSEAAWGACEEEREFAAVLRFHITQQLLTQNPSAKDVDRWRFGCGFLKSARDLGFYKDETKAKILLKSCAETILRTKMGATHWIRESEGGNSAQKCRGTAKAWRRDIDYEFHLHYWEDGGVVEFASVVTHNDFSIT